MNQKKHAKPFSNDLNNIEIIKYLKIVLGDDVKFINLALIYGVVISIFTLSIPISMQLLINSIAFFSLLQPIIIIGFILLAILVFSSFLKILQHYVIEIFQRRLMVRLSAKIGLILLNAKYAELKKTNETEFVNRFFDIYTVQKTAVVFINQSFLLIFQSFFGLILVTFYHPYLSLVCALIILSVFFTWKYFYKSAARYACLEGRARYDIGGYLEEIARSNSAFKSYKSQTYAKSKIDNLAKNYIEYRKKHFRISLTQIILLLLIYTIFSSVLLTVGGVLVVKGSLTLGQLVAAELILFAILKGIASFGKDFTNIYDLIAACEKLSQFFNIDQQDDKKSKIGLDKFDIKLDNVEIIFRNNNYHFNYLFEKNKNYLINCQDSSSRMLIVHLIMNYKKPDVGSIELDSINIADVNYNSLCSNISVLDNTHFVEGTLIEYLTLNNQDYDISTINKICSDIGLKKLINHNIYSLETRIVPSGSPFLEEEKILFRLVRIILMKPKIIILTEFFDIINDESKRKVINYLLTQTDINVISLANSLDNYLKKGDKKFDKFLSLDSKGFKELQN